MIDAEIYLYLCFLNKFKSQSDVTLESLTLHFVSAFGCFRQRLRFFCYRFHPDFSGMDSGCSCCADYQQPSLILYLFPILHGA